MHYPTASAAFVAASAFPKCLSFYFIVVFDVMGKALTGELSCPVTGLVDISEFASCSSNTYKVYIYTLLTQQIYSFPRMTPKIHGLCGTLNGCISCRFRLVFTPDNYPIRSLEISNFCRFIDVEWPLVHEDFVNH